MTSVLPPRHTGTPGDVPGRVARPGSRGDAALGEVTVGYQPILDIAAGVVAGYQAQAHLPAGDTHRLDVATPSVVGKDPDGLLTARIAEQALAAMPSLPANTFLTVPLAVEVAGSRAVRRVLLDGRPLAGLVLDIVGPIAAVPEADLVPSLERYRAAGALIAVGGYGAAQPELTSVVRLSPSILRLGRDWVRGIDRSESKRSAVDVIGQLAGQLDAWILAEGVCTAAELRTLSGLAVPLAQGPFIGTAREDWPEVEHGVRDVLPRRRQAPDAGAGALVGLVQQAYTTTDETAAATVLPETSGFDVVVVLDAHGRPVTLMEQAATAWDASPALSVNVDTEVADAVARAMTRPRLTRFTPLVATDETGRFVGIVRIERLMTHLAGGRRD